MGNSYSVAREEQEEEEFRRLVEAVEIAQQRSTGRDDLEAGLNDLRPPDPQRERPEDLGHDVLPDYIARPGPQFDVPWMQPQSPAPIIICPQAPALQPLQAPACFIATTPSTQSQASQDSVVVHATATASTISLPQIPDLIRTPQYYCPPPLLPRPATPYNRLRLESPAHYDNSSRSPSRSHSSPQWSTRAPQRPIPWSHSHSRSRSRSPPHARHLLRASRRTTRSHSQSPRRCLSPSPDRGRRRLRSFELRQAKYVQTSHSHSDYSVRRSARSRQHPSSRSRCRTPPPGGVSVGTPQCHEQSIHSSLSVSSPLPVTAHLHERLRTRTLSPESAWRCISLWPSPSTLSAGTDQNSSPNLHDCRPSTDPLPPAIQEDIDVDGPTPQVTIPRPRFPLHLPPPQVGVPSPVAPHDIPAANTAPIIIVPPSLPCAITSTWSGPAPCPSTPEDFVPPRRSSSYPSSDSSGSRSFDRPSSHLLISSGHPSALHSPSSPTSATAMDTRFEQLLNLHERSLATWERQSRLWYEQNTQLAKTLQSLEKQIILLRHGRMASVDSLVLLDDANAEKDGESENEKDAAKVQVQNLEYHPQPVAKGMTVSDMVKPYPHRPYAAGLRVVQRCSNDWSPPWEVFPLKAFRGSSYTYLKIQAHWDDAELLKELGRSYDKLRTVWRKWFSLRSVRSITMVYADHTCVYPRRLGPAGVSPSKNMRLRYFLRHPDQMKGRHEFMQVLTARTDLGIEFVEGWQLTRITIAILLPILLSTVLAVVYSIVLGDVSDAFTIAAYMTSAYSVCLVLLGLLNFVEF